MEKSLLGRLSEDDMETIIVKENTFEKARKSIRESQDKSIIFSSDDDELNRKIFEKEKIDALLINLAGRKDYQKQRNSGFNQVMAKTAQKKNIIIGINFDEIIDSAAFEKPKILARIRQNINLCKKNKLKMKFMIENSKNQRNIYDLKSLGLVLGMPAWMASSLESDKF